MTLENQWARIGGLREGKYPNSYYRFLGLRYAEPPVGKLRFQRPRLVKLIGDYSARKFGAPCPQPHPNDPNRITGSEDCLFLNVFTPKVIQILFVLKISKLGSASRRRGITAGTRLDTRWWLPSGLGCSIRRRLDR